MEGYLRSGSANIYYEIFGEENSEAVILLHGNGESGRSFKNLIPLISDKYKVIAIDSRGHGKSEFGVDRRNIDVLQIGTRYDYKLFKIVPIKLYHDVPQCGYRVLFDNYKVIYATDTKTLEGITAKNYDLYLIEGNYTDRRT